jgi:hypothetical protein
VGALLTMPAQEDSGPDSVIGGEGGGAELMWCGYVSGRAYSLWPIFGCRSILLIP